MSVHKRVYPSGRVVWRYVFDVPRSSRESRKQITVSGFATRKEAIEAEARRRVEIQNAIAKAKAGLVNAPPPRTLANLLEEFFREHADRRLSPKTTERYRQKASYLSPELLAMPIQEITPLHLEREWNRLLERGGRRRYTGEPRPLGPKTVRNIAGVVSAAFGHAVRWGLLERNPVTKSEPPRAPRSTSVALTAREIELLVAAASSPWCLGMIIELTAALGARRGEILALRWSDIQDGRARIERALCQTREGMIFKAPKSGRTRVVTIPSSALRSLEAHRLRQEEFRRQFGPDYRHDLDLVFAQPDGSPLAPDSISSAVSALFRRLKIPKPKGGALHLLRHSHGSHLLAKGVPLPAVAERLGHSSPYVTATVYAHAIRGQDDEAARRWDEAMQGEETVSAKVLQ